MIEEAIHTKRAYRNDKLFLFIDIRFRESEYILFIL